MSISSLFCGAIGALSGCASRNPSAAQLSAGATVLALGDSLTYGYGADPEHSYPAELARLTGWEVINAGINGEVSRQTLKRLPLLLKLHKPQLVLTCIGTNDFFLKIPREEVYQNIYKICQKIQYANTHQMLIAVPDFYNDTSMTPPLNDEPLYQQIAQELWVSLQQGALAAVVSQSQLKVDTIHANTQGYALFAKRIAQSLLEVGLLAQIRQV